MSRPLRRRRLQISLAIVAVALVVGTVSWYQVELRPVSSSTATQLFTVNAGQSTPTIARALHSAHLIRNKDAFITYLGIHGLRDKVKAGVFRLSPSDSGARIAKLMTANGPSARQITVIPGDTLDQVEQLAAEEGISNQSFEAALAAPHSEPILSSKPAGVSLEGYLYPDTYALGPDTTASQLIDTMIANLAQHLTPTLQQKFTAEGLTVHQALTLASIVEQEVSSTSDRAEVAQVFLKRLQLGMPLGSDVTAKYAAAQAGVPFSTSINSPYNTLINTGLPPGPICSPSLSSLEAVANPAPTDYLYFLAGDDGKTHFATTYAQHQQNIALYLSQ